jgi:hypothetical protein
VRRVSGLRLLLPHSVPQMARNPVGADLKTEPDYSNCGFADCPNCKVKARYRVVEVRPNWYVVQRRGLLWGWNTCGHDYGDDEYSSAQDAEAHARNLMALEDHAVRVVKELP